MVDKALKGALEDNLLTILCWSEEHGANLALQLAPELFSTKIYREIAAKAIEHIERYSVPPKGHLRDLFERQLQKGEEGKLLWKTLDAMEALQADLQPEYVLSEMSRFISVRTLAMAVEEAADRLHNGDLEEAREALYAQQAPPPGSSGIWLNKPSEALAFLNEKEDEDYFSMGIDVLDERGVRPKRGTMTLLVAPAKAGKSWFLINVGKAALLHRHDVLHITVENSAEITSQRYVQALYGMTAEKTDTIRIPVFKRDELGRCTAIDFDTLTPEILNSGSRANIAKRLTKLRSRFLIKHFPMGSLTVAQLNAYMDYLKRVENFTPDLLIVDYPDKMAVNPNNLRIDLGQIFIKLAGLAQARHLALVTVTQGNRSAADSKVVSATQVAEDYTKIGTADTVLTYSKTPQERELNLARILVAACRFAKDQYMTLISQSYDTGQFCLDSVYMQKQLASEVARLSGEDAEDE